MARRFPSANAFTSDVFYCAREKIYNWKNCALKENDLLKKIEKIYLGTT